jgi:type I restriction enzyme R subunit
MTSNLVRRYAALANEMQEAGFSDAEIEEIKIKVKYYEHLRAEIKLASGDYIDLKSYEPAMRHLIDTYISAEESKKISAFDDLTLLELIVERGKDAINALPDAIKNDREAVAETIENNVRKVINDEHPTNPKYFEKMSYLLDVIIRERKKEAIDYKKYLENIVDLTKKVKKPEETSDYPQLCNTRARRALYDNLNNEEELVYKLDDEIRRTKKDKWRGNIIKEREVKYVIKKHITDYAVAKKIFELVKNQNEY